LNPLSVDVAHSDIYTKEDFKIAIRQLVESKNGYYSYRNLYLEHGQGKDDKGVSEKDIGDD
jgi:hypothetical protein